ncbi:unannotated protein [freshwater metagenome]|uniref:Unannotated protein n=1 Tax=freshwater metagenome TaxID=449393 RepID=A0A6J6DSC0_9ZZZZ
MIAATGVTVGRVATVRAATVRAATVDLVAIVPVAIVGRAAIVPIVARATVRAASAVGRAPSVAPVRRSPRRPNCRSVRRPSA